MQPITITTLGGVFAVLVYDTLGSLLSQSIGFNYSWLTIGSIFIYGTVGYFSSRESLLFGVLAAAIVGMVDSTLGWWISWRIGPGAIPDEIDATTIAFTIVFVSIIAAVTGLLGALVRRAIKPQ